MGFLQRLPTLVMPRSRAQTADPADPFARQYSGFVPPGWLSALSAAGIAVTPDLSMTLSAYYSGVTMKAYDIATLPCQIFRRRDDEGKDRVPARLGLDVGGIQSLAYRLRWQPNAIQTATEFWASMIVQLELREVGYAEIASGATGFADQLLPRHPDRVTPERLPSGRLRYRLMEVDGRPRYLTQDEMFVIRGLSVEGITMLTRTQYAAQSFGLALAAQRAASRFFKSGMTASVVATYKGDTGDEGWEEDIHKSITRYAAGMDNTMGLLLVPDLVDVKNLSVDPDKAQMMLAQEWGVREVARYLRMPGSKLGIKDSVSYNSQVQAAVDYVIGCLRETAVLIEQSVQRDLILAKDTYFSEFLLEALLRGDPDARAAYYEKAIRNRWMRPSEVRLRENLNPDPALDQLSERDFQPGNSGQPSGPAADARAIGAGRSPKAEYHHFLLTHDNAARCVRRERLNVEKLAKKHASDPEGWRVALREFYGEHAGHIAHTMRIRTDIARGYAAEHGSAFEARGVAIIDGSAGEAWERDEATALAELALEPEAKEAA
jgi:HK97 family phage portal protein